MKRRIALLAAVGILLAACGSSTAAATDGDPPQASWVSVSDGDRYDMYTHQVPVDGWTVPCIGITNGNSISLSCDWAAK